jgi:hypothetical protein
VKERAQVALAASLQAEVDASAGPAAPAPAGTGAAPGGEASDNEASGIEAVGRLRALGRGYIGFALAEPGLFRTAFCRSGAGHAGRRSGMLDSPAFRMMAATLDDLVAAGLLSKERRPFGETAAWSTAHGLAMLLLDGPLNETPEQARGPLIEGVLDAIVSGLTCP